MRASICDICYMTSGKYVEAKWVSSRKMGADSFRVDLCVEHQNWMKQYKTIDECRTAYLNLHKGV